MLIADVFKVDVNRLSHKSGTLFAVLIFALLVGPAWFLFQFAPDLFFKLDIFRFVLISCGIGFPLTALNIALVISFSQSIGEYNNVTDFPLAVLEASCITIFVLYAPCCLTFFGHVSLSFAQVTSSILQLLLTILFIYASIKESKKRKKVP